VPPLQCFHTVSVAGGCVANLVFGKASFSKIVIVFHFNECSEVCARGNGRLGVARKVLKMLVPARRFELLTPRV
jgi:hypothetical protein